MLEGMIFGLSAGLIPGPLMMTIITMTLQYSRRQGLMVALMPLLAELPIIALVARGIASHALPVRLLTIIGLLGGCFLLRMGYGLLTHKPHLPHPSSTKSFVQFTKAFFVAFLNQNRSTGDHAKPITGSYLFQLIQKLAKQLQLEGKIDPEKQITPHSFRTTFVKLALDRKQTNIEIMNATGHSTSAMVKYYGNSEKLSMRIIIVVISNFLCGLMSMNFLEEPRCEVTFKTLRSKHMIL